MIKRVGIYTLEDGTDPEEFWKYHTQVHADDAMRLAGTRLKKYVINRIVKVVSGKPVFFGFAETWWDSEEDMHQAFEVDGSIVKADSEHTVSEDFLSRVKEESIYLVEEHVVKDFT